MKGFQHLKQQLLPLFKGLPIIVLVFLGFLFAAKKIINYTPNVYQTMAKIKLDDQKYGMSNNNLYSDFDLFSTENKITAEVEVLKSPLLIEKALDSIQLDVVIYRKGKFKNTMLYNDSPLLVSYAFTNEALYEECFTIHVLSESDLELIIGDPKNGRKVSGVFGTSLVVDGGQVTIEKNTELLAKRTIDLIGDYEVKFYTKVALINYLSERLDVKAVDKEIAVLRVVFKEEHAQKAADFTNTLCRAYLNDYVVTKSNAANQAVNFIDEKLDEVSQKLNRAERDLESFKKTNNVVNTTQETETGLREISKLNVQLINLETTALSMQQALEAISEDKDLDISAVKFGFGDLLMTELVKKYKNLQEERYETLSKYKEDSENVKLVEAKILEVKKYLRQAIKQNLIDIEVQRNSLELQVQESSRMFENLPTREKNHQILEREFQLQEEVYNFLSQKRIEANIASSAMISFHRIIQKAEVPTHPVSPNKVLITFLMGLVGLIIGIGFIYIRRFAKAKIMTRDDIEKLTSLPVLNVIRKQNTGYDFTQLAKALILKDLVHKNQAISINSTLGGEGKTYVSKYLSSSLVNMGYTVCHLSIHSEAPYSTEVSIPESVDKKVVNYAMQTLQDDVLNQLKTNFDFVVIDSVSAAKDITGIEIMKQSDVSLYLIRANYTGHSYAPYAEILMDEYRIHNLHLVLNDAHVATNYTGSFVGSRFQKNSKPKGLINRIKYYYQTYLN